MHLPYEAFGTFSDSGQYLKSDTKHRHVIRQGVYNGKNYFCKQADSVIMSQFELLAQSIFRIVDPLQPNIVLLQANQSTVQVLSESVEGFHSFRSRAQHFNKTNYRAGSGLGQILIVAAYVQENDLKDGNIGLDLKGHVIKIDGDCAFWDLENPLSTRQFQLSSQLIEALPHPGIGKFSPYNWIGFINEEIATVAGTIFDTNLSQNPAFKREIYEGILKIALLPDEFLIRMVEASGAEDSPMIILPPLLAPGRISVHLLQNLTEEAFSQLKQQVMWSSNDDLKRVFLKITVQNYKTRNFDHNGHEGLLEIVQSNTNHKTNLLVFLTQRRDFLLQSALNIEEFKSYLMSPEASQLQTDFVRYLETFMFNERHLIADGLAIEHLIAARFNVVRPDLSSGIDLTAVSLEENPEATSQTIETIRADCESLLAELHEAIVNQHDLLNRFIQEKAELLSQKLDLHQLEALKTELEETLACVSSHEVLAVKRVIAEIGSKWSIFGESGAREKAQRIEQALAEMPIDQRYNVISSHEINDLKKALASHELGFIFSGINLVNSFFASSTYTELKKEFSSPTKPKQ